MLSLKAPFLRVSVLAASLPALSACGFLVSGHHIAKAQGILDAATLAKANELAPYEYTLAEEFLKKAREKMSYSDYEVASTFAENAEKYATQADEKARTQSVGTPTKGAITTTPAPATSTPEPTPAGTPNK